MTASNQTGCPQCGGSLEGLRPGSLPAGSRDQSRAARAPDERDKVHAIAFDVFGTLLRITDPRDPWRQIARAGTGFLLDPRREAVTLPQFAAACDADWTDWWADDLATELASIRVHEDGEPTLAALRKAGFRLAIVSNLALPFVRPVHLALRDHVDAEIYSCELGAVKPQPAIFGAVCVALDLSPGRILMVGDSLNSDVRGARDFGMPALHLVRDRRMPNKGEISSLGQLLGLIDRSAP